MRSSSLVNRTPDNGEEKRHAPSLFIEKSRSSSRNWVHLLLLQYFAGSAVKDRDSVALAHGGDATFRTAMQFLGGKFCCGSLIRKETSGSPARGFVLSA